MLRPAALRWGAFRDLNYLRSFGVYEAGERIQLSVDFPADSARWTCLAIAWPPEASGGPRYQHVEIAIDTVSNDRVSITLPGSLPSCACLLHCSVGKDVFAQIIVVNGKEAASGAELTVVRPTFTEWGYHRFGFYRNERRRIGDRLISFVANRVPGSGRLLFPLRSVFPRLLRYPYFNPAHESVDLDSIYETNPRWLRGSTFPIPAALFDKTPLALPPEHDTWPGMWTEDVKSTLPVFALLQRAGIRFATISDVDVHSRSEKFARTKALLFYAQELMTKEYFANLTAVLREQAKRVVFFGVQGLGYKEVDFDRASGRLCYLGEKATDLGLSGERVSGRRPSWDRKDAAEFGFEFPLPTKNWRVMTRSMVIRNREHPMMAGLASSYDYEVSDWNGTTVAGLTRAGGEYFVQSHSDAETLATLDDTHLVGIGVYRNLVVLSPTYWPSFGFYQYDRHPEVIELLRRAVRVDMTTRQSGAITTAS